MKFVVSPGRRLRWPRRHGLRSKPRRGWRTLSLGGDVGVDLSIVSPLPPPAPPEQKAAEKDQRHGGNDDGNGDGDGGDLARPSRLVDYWVTTRRRIGCGRSGLNVCLLVY